MDTLLLVKPFLALLRLPGGEVDRGCYDQGNDGQDEANQAQDAKDATGPSFTRRASRANLTRRASGARGAWRASRANLTRRASGASRTSLTRRASRAYRRRRRGALWAGAWANTAGRQVHHVSAPLLPVSPLLGSEGAYPEGYLAF